MVEWKSPGAGWVPHNEPESWRALSTAWLTPTAMNAVIPDETIKYASGWSYRVRVAVPKEQAAQAVVLLRRFDQQADRSLRRHTRALRRPLLISLLTGLVTAAIVVIFALADDVAFSPCPVFGLPVLAFALSFLFQAFRRPPGKSRRTGGE
jgi:hypothetical protein